VKKEQSSVGPWDLGFGPWDLFKCNLYFLHHMPYAETCEALVLRVYNVGEADRYCILFTRERGRLAARASAVRKLKSRMGGSLLPFQQVRVQLKEGSAGWMLAGAEATGERAAHTLEAFSVASQGIEILLHLTQEDEPLPEVFDATLQFLDVCSEGYPHAILSYTLCLLHLLGFLPATEDLKSAFDLSLPEEQFIETSRRGMMNQMTAAPLRKVGQIGEYYLKEQLVRPLKAGGVAGSINQSVLSKSQIPMTKSQ
jgi:hypothetical protein